jgi:hypothetical protein
MEPQNAEQLVEDDDRDGESGSRAERQQGFTAAERGVVELGGDRHVLDYDGLPTAQGEVRDGELVRTLERRKALVMPLGLRHSGCSGEPDETALDAKDPCRLFDRHAQKLVEVELRSHSCGQPSDEAFALERILDRPVRRGRL